MCSKIVEKLTGYSLAYTEELMERNQRTDFSP